VIEANKIDFDFDFDVADFYVPPIVLIIGLCLIVFLALLSLVLVILQCRRCE
jgi:hypothetical protein